MNELPSLGGAYGWFESAELVSELLFQRVGLCPSGGMVQLTLIKREETRIRFPQDGSCLPLHFWSI